MNLRSLISSPSEHHTQKAYHHHHGGTHSDPLSDTGEAKSPTVGVGAREEGGRGKSRVEGPIEERREREREKEGEKQKQKQRAERKAQLESTPPE